MKRFISLMLVLVLCFSLLTPYALSSEEEVVDSEEVTAAESVDEVSPSSEEIYEESLDDVVETLDEIPVEATLTDLLEEVVVNQTPAEEAVVCKPKLILSLAPEKAVYDAGDEIVLTVGVANDGTELVGVDLNLDFDGWTVKSAESLLEHGDFNSSYDRFIGLAYEEKGSQIEITVLNGDIAKITLVAPYQIELDTKDYTFTVTVNDAATSGENHVAFEETSVQKTVTVNKATSQSDNVVLEVVKVKSPVGNTNDVIYTVFAKTGLNKLGCLQFQLLPSDGLSLSDTAVEYRGRDGYWVNYGLISEGLEEVEYNPRSNMLSAYGGTDEKSPFGYVVLMTIKGSIAAGYEDNVSLLLTNIVVGRPDATAYKVTVNYSDGATRIPVTVSDGTGIYNAETESINALVYVNIKDSYLEKENNQRCYSVDVSYPGVTTFHPNSWGELTLPSGCGDVTFSKSGFVSRTISEERLRKSSNVYLQRVSDHPVISAVWADDLDIMRDELKLTVGSTTVVPLEVEVDWGSSSGSLALYQEGRTLHITERGTSVQLGLEFDVTKPIYIVATNEEGLTSSKVLCVAEDIIDENLDGFEFSIPELSLTLPDDLTDSSLVNALFGGSKLDFGLFSPVPVEVERDGNKIYYAIGYKSSGSVKNGKTEAKDRAESVKSLRDSVKEAKTETEKIAKIQEKMAQSKSNLATLDGSFGWSSGMTIMGFVEGYITETGDVVILDSGGFISLDASVSYTQPFMAGPIPMFMEFKFSASTSTQFNLYKNDLVKAFTPDLEITAVFSFSAGVGVGVNKVASVSGGATGKLSNTIIISEAYAAEISYYQLKASLELYVKATALFFEFQHDFEVADAVWYEWPEKTALTESSPGAVSEDGIYDTSLYEAVDLNYLDGLAEPEVNSNSADASFIAEVYENANPQLAVFEDGSMLALWIGNDPDSNGGDALRLYYTYYSDGSWSEPAQVWNDGTLDNAPSLAVIGDEAYVVWQNAASSVNGIDSLDGVAGLMDIAGAKFDRSSVSFTASKITSGNGLLDMTPTLCGDGSNVYAVWVQNSANAWFGDSGSNSILSASYADGSWGSANSLFTSVGPILSLSADYNEGVIAAWSADTDGDLNTSTDIEIYKNGARLTENEVLDNGVYFHDHTLYWYSDGMLMADGVAMLNEGTVLGSDDFQIVSGNGQKIVLYTAGDGSLGTILYGQFYDSGSGKFGGPVALSGNEANIPYFAAYIDENGALSVLMESQAVIGDYDDEEPYGTASLIWYNKPTECDLCLNNVVYDATEYVAGESMNFTLDLSNLGSINVSGVKTEILDADETVLLTETSTDALLSGESTQLEYVLPIEEIEQGKTLTIRVTPVGYDDVDMTNNTAEAVLSWADAAVENLRSGITETCERAISAEIVNRGYDAFDLITVTLHSGTQDGTVLATETVENLGSLDAALVTFAVNPTDEGVYYICIEHPENDENRGNDSAFLVLGEADHTPGDVTGDDEVNLVDVLRLLKSLTGQKVKMLYKGDVNNDSAVDIKDVIHLAKFVLGRVEDIY